MHVSRISKLKEKMMLNEECLCYYAILNIHIRAVKPLNVAFYNRFQHR